MSREELLLRATDETIDVLVESWSAPDNAFFFVMVVYFSPVAAGCLFERPARALSELEAERSHLRLDGEPVILYSLLSPPAQAHANLFRELYCLDAAMTVSLEWRPWAVEAARRRIRGAQRHYFAERYSMMAHVQETEGTAAAMGGLGRCDGVRPAGRGARRAGSRRGELRRGLAHRFAPW